MFLFCIYSVQQLVFSSRSIGKDCCVFKEKLLVLYTCVCFYHTHKEQSCFHGDMLYMHTG